MIHVKLWSGSRSARITDMENAGKRGKLCRMLRVSGTPWSPGDSRLTDDQRKALDFSTRVFDACYWLAGEHAHDNLGFLLALDFDEATAGIRAIVAEARAAGIPEWACSAYDEICKGIHAPRPVLTAGVEGKWSAGADETGICISDLQDVNEWREITPHDQTGPRAYDLAAKVWDRVKAATTRGEASAILHAAGCRLHGYCGLD